MQKPYYVLKNTSEWEYMKPFLEKWGYKLDIYEASTGDKICLNKACTFISNYISLDPKIDRYEEKDIHKFLEWTARNVNQKYNIVEIRNISISLEEAKEWYKSNNPILKELALKAYSENELFSWEEYAKRYNSLYSINLPMGLYDRHNALAKLETAANYLNGDWRKEPNVWAVRIVRVKGNIVYSTDQDDTAGAVWFKDLETAKKAVEILGEETINLTF